MATRNNKLSACVAGWFMVWICAWLIDFGQSLPVPESFQVNGYFVAYYYPLLITGLCSIIFTVIFSWFLPKYIQLNIGQYFLWLTVPIISALAFLVIIAHSLILPFLSASMPMLCVLSIVYAIEKRDFYLPERLRVW